VHIDALIADAVSISRGKLDVVGAGWNHLFVPEVPTNHGRVGLGILVSVRGGPLHRHHSVVVRLDDPTGQPVILGAANGGRESPSDRVEVSFRSRPPFPDSPLDEYVFPIAINLERVVFQHPGVHRFRIAHDGAEVASIPFVIAEASLLASDQPGDGDPLDGGPAGVDS